MNFSSFEASESGVSVSEPEDDRVIVFELVALFLAGFDCIFLLLMDVSENDRFKCSSLSLLEFLDLGFALAVLLVSEFVFTGPFLVFFCFEATLQNFLFLGSGGDSESVEELESLDSSELSMMICLGIAFQDLDYDFDSSKMVYYAMGDK